MIGQLLAKVIGTQNERELKRLQPRVVQISALEPAIQPLSDDQLRGKTAEFRQRVANGEPLDDLLPEAFAVVREVDSILIDEARTPLIISGPAEESTDLYYEVDRVIPRLKRGATTQGNVKAEDREELEKTGDYIVDEKHKTVTLTETGMAKAEEMLSHRLVPDSGGLYDPVNMPLLHHVQQGLRAHTLFRLDVDYMIKDNGVVIVDEFTGRLMPGRRWSDGLHQAVEAKEKVKIERENQTLATITFQNYFRKYKKLSGMTGTAETEAPEFNKIYSLDVIAIPTNRPLRRIEEADLVYRTEREKYEAIVNDILE